MDHLTEDRDYYQKLKKMESGGSSEHSPKPNAELATTPLRKKAAELIQTLIFFTKTGAYTYVPRNALDSVLKEGLHSGEALLKRKDLLSMVAANRGITPDQMAQDIQSKLKGFKPDSARGANVMFSPPPAGMNLPANHPMKTWDLAQVKVDIDSLLRDQPDTRVHGQELVPYDENKVKKLGDAYADMRYHDLTSQELSQLHSRSPADLWKGYSAPEGKGMYAPNVPHAALVTNNGILPA